MRTLPPCAAMPTRCATGSPAKPAGRCRSSAKARASSSGRRISPDPMRGLTGYDRRRYVLLCSGLRGARTGRPADHALRCWASRLLQLAAEPTLVQAASPSRSETHHERRELVTVCRTLLDLGVLQRVAGDEEAFVQRRRRAGRRSLRRPAPHARRHAGCRARSIDVGAGGSAGTLEERLHALVDEHVADSDEGRRTASASPACTPPARRSGGLPRDARSRSRAPTSPTSEDPWPPACATLPGWSPSNAPKGSPWSMKPAR